MAGYEGLHAAIRAHRHRSTARAIRRGAPPTPPASAGCVERYLREQAA